jgi:hypothetical protein
VRKFTNANYHAGLRKEGDEIIVVQIARDVQRVRDAKDAEFRFPLEKHHDLAFDTPQGWLHSWWRDQPTMCRIPTAVDAGAHPSTIDVMLRSHMAQIDADPDLPPDAAKPADKPRTTPAVVIPAGDGLVTLQPELAATECPTEEESDLESILSVAETLENMTNLRKYAFGNWMREVMQGRIGEGPPEKCVGDGPPGVGCRKNVPRCVDRANLYH